MADKNRPEGKISVKSEDFEESHRSLIRGAKKILDTLTSVWKLSVAGLIISFAALGAIAVILDFTILPKTTLFLDGIIFLAIAAWIFARNIVGRGCSCCTEDIPKWKSLLLSFMKPDGTIDSQKEGEGIVDSVMQIIYASDEWVSSIRRDLLSMFVWPILAVIVLSLSVFTLDIFSAKIVALAFIIYVFTLAVTIYYGLNLKFRRWQSRVALFKANVDQAWQKL